MSKCKWATNTGREWVRGLTHCNTVECRNPSAIESFDAFGEMNKVGVVRRPCDADFNLLSNPDCVHVRSGYCNDKDCPLFESEN